VSETVIPPYHERILDPKEQEAYELYAEWCRSMKIPAGPPETWRRTTMQIKGGGGVDAP